MIPSVPAEVTHRFRCAILVPGIFSLLLFTLLLLGYDVNLSSVVFIGMVPVRYPSQLGPSGTYAHTYGPLGSSSTTAKLANSKEFPQPTPTNQGTSLNAS